MNRSFLKGLLILACLSSIASICYAWPEVDIGIYPFRHYRPLGDFEANEPNSSIMAACGSGGPIETWEWYWPSGAYAKSQTDTPDNSTIRFRFSSTGRYSFGVIGYNELNQWDYDNCLFYVFEMNLDMDGVSDDDEEDPGGYVFLNDDDDDGNGTPDKDDPNTVPGENDLVAISLSYEPSSLYPGYIELNIPYGGTSHIRVWEDPNKQNMVIPDGSKSYKRWLVGTQPSTLYVEGHYVGTRELDLHYSNSTDPNAPVYPGGIYKNDKIKVTVVDPKMIFKVYGDETSEITRAETGSFEVVDSDGNPIDSATYSNWAFDGEIDVNDANHTSRIWSGTIVEPGTASCDVTIGVSTVEVSKTITVNARSGWSITPTCAQDNEPSYGSYPGYVPGGENREVNRHKPDIIWPRGDDFEDGYTTEKVSSGPNEDVWFISSSTFAIDRETCINKFLKPNATGYPNPPNVRWHEYNESQGVDADGLLTGLKGHEAYGTPGNPQGHQKYLEDEEANPNRDAKTAIEDNVAATEAALKSVTGSEVTWIDAAIESATKVEPIGNWGPATVYIYDFSNSRWEPETYGF